MRTSSVSLSGGLAAVINRREPDSFGARSYLDALEEADPHVVVALGPEIEADAGAASVRLVPAPLPRATFTETDENFSRFAALRCTVTYRATHLWVGRTWTVLLHHGFAGTPEQGSAIV